VTGIPRRDAPRGDRPVGSEMTRDDLEAVIRRQLARLCPDASTRAQNLATDAILTAADTYAAGEMDRAARRRAELFQATR
jgi:hypothetical protein